jgi:uncharacterized protein (UPF0332 family)
LPILRPEHLIEQAEKLIVRPPHGPPRQVDLRRAISSAYYAIFHFAMAELANEVVGARWRATHRYALIYRSVDHAQLRKVCDEVSRPLPTPKIRQVFPSEEIDPGVVAFASAATELQQRRHDADYDPLGRYVSSDAKSAIAAARIATRRLAAAPIDHRKSFLTLLLRQPR